MVPSESSSSAESSVLPPLLQRLLAARSAIRVWPALAGLRHMRDQEKVPYWLDSICRLPGLRLNNGLGALNAEKRAAACAENADTYPQLYAAAAASAARAAVANANDINNDVHAAGCAAMAAAPRSAAKAIARAEARAEARGATANDKAFLEDLPSYINTSERTSLLREIAHQFALRPLWPSGKLGAWWFPVMNNWRNWVTTLGREDLAERYDRWMDRGIEFDEWVEWSAAGWRLLLDDLSQDGDEATDVLHRLALGSLRKLHPLVSKIPGGVTANARREEFPDLTQRLLRDEAPHPLWLAWQLEIQLPHTRAAWEAAAASVPLSPARVSES